MDEKDAKIRKQWLWMYVLNLVQSAAWFALLAWNPVVDGVVISRYPMFIGGVIGLVGFAYPAYHCIYKKPGTKLVTFYLAVGALSLLMNALFAMLGKLPPTDHIPYYKAMQPISYVIAVCWFVTSWKIRAVNKKLRALIPK